MRRVAIDSRPYGGARTARERRRARFGAPGCELLRALDDAAATLGAVARRLLILGSTGSIGTQALDIVARSPELELVGLSAERSWETLVEQAAEHRVARVALVDADAGARAAEAWTDGEVLVGAEGLVRLVLESEADLVLNALVGSAGLGPTVATLGEGIDLALANKESLVVGGELVTQLAEATGARIIPVDSEHSALHQLIDGAGPGTVDRLVLTASGGPFRGRTRAELAGVTVEEALRHPTWAMGGKITIDSATLMNKGLELIEAHHLFGTPYERIDVVVHPQSIVHSYVLLCDGAALAHLGHPDMRVPISYALHHPERVDVPVKALDLAAIGALTFEAVDTDAFPCLRLAREAAGAGGTAPCVLNAANEVAVHAFLQGRLDFLGIPAVIEETLELLPPQPVRAFESLYDADREARAVATELVTTDRSRA
jgi:1-deoxy-D-xylulose-5-phosphate reductoisomerase